MITKDTLIVALDVSDFGRLVEITQKLQDEVGIYKLGHQVFTAEGPKVIRYLKEQGKKVFLDLKLHEISNSVAGAIRSAGKHGVDMISVHASGGRRMMEAAVKAASEFEGMKILALTVVTELSDFDLQEMGFMDSCEVQVLRLAKLAEESGCHGVIASPLEVKKLKEVISEKMLIVTPGVRLSDRQANNTLGRLGSPEDAIREGASHIVVGRPIIEAEDPVAVVRQIRCQIAESLRQTGRNEKV